MRYYPINLDIQGRTCAVVGGGLVAERKVTALLAAGASVTVISPHLSAGLAAMLPKRVQHIQRVWQAGDLSGFFLVICATDNESVNAAAAREAKAAGALVNVVDRPEFCDFTLPALVERGELLLTVSTGGVSPALSRCIREQLEETYGEQFGLYLAELEKFRQQIKACLATPGDREAFWRVALDRQILALVREGRFTEAKEKIEHAVGCARAQS